MMSTSGRRCTVYVMSSAQEWAYGVTGVQAYITQCKSYGLLSIGCNNPTEDCASSWGSNNCISMPAGWGCIGILRDLKFDSSVFVISQNCTALIIQQLASATILYAANVTADSACCDLGSTPACNPQHDAAP